MVHCVNSSARSFTPMSIHDQVYDVPIGKFFERAFRIPSSSGRLEDSCSSAFHWPLNPRRRGCSTDDLSIGRLKRRQDASSKITPPIEIHHWKYSIAI